MRCANPTSVSVTRHRAATAIRTLRHLPELNIVLDLRLFVDVILGKEEGCFVGPDTYILVLVIWSPLPVPCRPMVAAQLDQFTGVDRDIPLAPLWAAEVQGSRESPLKFLRTAHWVRKQVEGALSPFTTTLSPNTFDIWTSLINEINTLIGPSD
ncbi:hypothetical protein LXA43DRAFT_1100269 [Ganoderma leucocontextum]|nr:hypothetical protein LXA43DRAFT_1100269 [Ganoderma leucocontextum]